MTVYHSSERVHVWSVYIHYRERTAVVNRARLAWVMGVFADTQGRKEGDPWINGLSGYPQTITTTSDDC